MVGAALLVPALTILVLFRVYPLVLAAILSFERWDGISAPQWVGAQNYEALIHDPPLGRRKKQSRRLDCPRGINRLFVLRGCRPAFETPRGSHIPSAVLTSGRPLPLRDRCVLGPNT